PELDATVALKVGGASAGADYAVTVTVYRSRSDGSLLALSTGTTAATAADGTVQFAFPLPPADPNPGTLYVVVEDVVAPSGTAAWARGLDNPNLATLPY